MVFYSKYITVISVDPYVQAPGWSQSFNRYSYAFNNPLVYTDPSGEVFGLDDLASFLIGV
jgi:RHS repeat-associated protein